MQAPEGHSAPLRMLRREPHLRSVCGTVGPMPQTSLTGETPTHYMLLQIYKSLVGIRTAIHDLKTELSKSMSELAEILDKD